MLLRHSLILFTVSAVLTLRDAAAHGAYHDEIKRLDALVATSPEDALNWFQRGCLHLSHAEWQQAVLDLERADRLAPGRYPVDFVRGEALLTGGRFTEARAALDHFLKTHPEHAPALGVRALVLLKLDKPADAFADFRSAIAKSATPAPDLYQGFADALASYGRQKEAASVLQEGIKKFGDIPALVVRALELEASTGQFDAALTRVEAMQKTALRPELWMAKRAGILAQAGRSVEARTAWQALAAHIEALPNLVRGSHSMRKLAEQAAIHAAPAPSVATPSARAPASLSAGP